MFRLLKRALAIFAAIFMLQGFKELETAADAGNTKPGSGLALIPASSAQLAPLPKPPASIRLQGKAEVSEAGGLGGNQRQYLQWQASQFYAFGAAAMAANNLPVACDAFRRAGDAFDAAVGPSKFTGQPRFAEGQTRRLMRQNAEAAALFQIAVPMLAKFEPGSPFIKDGVQYMAALSGGKKAKITGQPLKPAFDPNALHGQVDLVDRNVPLKGQLTQLDDGTKVASLKETELFSGNKKYYLQQAAAVDLGDPYLKNTVYKAFLKMNCLEFSELGANYYTAGDHYKPLKSAGKSLAIGVADDLWTPSIRVKLNGREYAIPVDLPDVARNHQNVVLLSDERHIIAIDPKTLDTWQLLSCLTRRPPDFEWKKLTHYKPGTGKAMARGKVPGR